MHQGKLMPRPKSKDTFFFAGAMRTPLSVVQLEITGKLPQRNKTVRPAQRMRRQDWGKDLAEVVEQRDIRAYTRDMENQRNSLRAPPTGKDGAPVIREGTPLGKEGTPDLSISLTGTAVREQELPSNEITQLMVSRPQTSEKSLNQYPEA